MLNQITDGGKLEDALQVRYHLLKTCASAITQYAGSAMHPDITTPVLHEIVHDKMRHAMSLIVSAYDSPPEVREWWWLRCSLQTNMGGEGIGNDERLAWYRFTGGGVNCLPDLVRTDKRLRDLYRRGELMHPERGSPLIADIARGYDTIRAQRDYYEQVFSSWDAESYTTGTDETTTPARPKLPTSSRP